MSQENVAVVARLVDAWNQANVEVMLALFDPECEVIFPPEVPEPGPFHGQTELREWAEGFLAAWESHPAEVVELIEADHSIVAILHLIGRGSGSGIEMDETDAHVDVLLRHRPLSIPLGLRSANGERRAEPPRRASRGAYSFCSRVRALEPVGCGAYGDRGPEPEDEP